MPTKKKAKAKVKRKYVRKAVTAHKAMHVFLTPDVQLDLTLKSIAEMFPNDPSGPGISLAWIAKTQEYYASITRFRQGYGEGRYVIHRARGRSIFACLNDLMNQWKSFIKPQQNATDMLRKLR
jgi:hypothetical protein